jgi:MFS family permease
MALIVANTPPTRMGTALSLAQTGVLTGQTLGPAVGAVLATIVERQHWLFCISGGMPLTAGALTALFVREVKQLAPGPCHELW